MSKTQLLLCKIEGRDCDSLFWLTLDVVWLTCNFFLQELAPHTSPIFVSAFRLLPAGVALVAWAAANGRQQPKGWQAWLACALFGLVDGTAFQVTQTTYASLLGKVLSFVCGLYSIFHVAHTTHCKAVAGGIAAYAAGSGSVVTCLHLLIHNSCSSLVTFLMSSQTCNQLVLPECPGLAAYHSRSRHCHHLLSLPLVHPGQSSGRVSCDAASPAKRLGCSLSMPSCCP